MLHSSAHAGYSGISGSGVIALREIPMGTAVWGPCPSCRTWTAGEQQWLTAAVVSWLDEFGYRRADRSLIVPCAGAYLINHSCEPNVLDYGLAAGIAVRDIAAGEEVTCDYRTFRHDDAWEFSCTCGSRACLGVVRSISGDYPAGLASDWRARMEPALARARALSQEIPLSAGSVLSPGLVDVR
jgi:hypothetical protein